MKTLRLKIYELSRNLLHEGLNVFFTMFIMTFVFIFGIALFSLAFSGNIIAIVILFVFSKCLIYL